MLIFDIQIVDKESVSQRKYKGGNLGQTLYSWCRGGTGIYSERGSARLCGVWRLCPQWGPGAKPFVRMVRIELKRDGREERERKKRGSAPHNDGSATRWDINNSMFLPIENY